MKKLTILVCCQGSPLSTSAYYVRALRRAHTVFVCGPRLNLHLVKQWKAWERDHALKTPGSWEEDKYGLLRRLALRPDIVVEEGAYQPTPEWLQRSVPARPDLLLWIDGGSDFQLAPNLLGLPTACLMIDTHTDPSWRLSLSSYFQFRFFAQRPDCARMQNSYWLPVAADPHVYRPYAVQEAYDIIFVGQTSPQWHARRIERLERIRAAGIDLRVGSKILDEAALLWCRGRLAFNGALAEDLNMRVFETLACGRLLLTDRLPAEAGLEHLFTDRYHLAIYDTTEHLIELIQYYLARPAERAAIGAAGRREILAKHTYAHRADQLLEIIFGPGACASCVEAQEEG